MASRLPYCWGHHFPHVDDARRWLDRNGYTPNNPDESVPYRFVSGNLSAQLLYMTHPNGEGGTWAVIVTLAGGPGDVPVQEGRRRPRPDVRKIEN